MNRSKDLRKLFRESLINSRSVGGTYPSNGIYNSPMYRRGNNYPNEVVFGKDTRIYFYEWSDINKVPKSFFTLSAFESFIRDCGITLELYQREIINNLGTVYITCYRNSKELNIRSSYKSLMDAMNEHDRKSLSSSISKPSTVYEPNNRWPQCDGSYFG